MSDLPTSLSVRGDDFKGLCESMAWAVASSIRPMVGDPASGDVLEMGADGTPTKFIDKTAEDAALAVLRRDGRGFRVLSEELGEAVIGNDPEYFIHLDPLDGTFNAIRGIPFYSVSIFISNRDISFGYVYDLARGTVYFAESGRGSWMECEGTIRRHSVSKTGSLDDFSVSAYTIRPNTGRVVALGDCVRRIRTLGCTSLELCYLADGKLDAFVDMRGALRVVDVAAGIMIVQEAGGVVTDGIGRRIHLRQNMWQKRSMMASNGLLHGELLKLVGDGPGGEWSFG